MLFEEKVLNLHCKKYFLNGPDVSLGNFDEKLRQLLNHNKEDKRKELSTEHISSQKSLTIGYRG